jgi:hypothetical protein
VRRKAERDSKTPIVTVLYEITAPRGLDRFLKPKSYVRIVSGRLAIDDGEAEMVRELFRRYLTGAGAEEIARALNDEGSQHRGKRWSGELDYQCGAFAQSRKGPAEAPGFRRRFWMRQ